jgi:hypothetical protein
LEQTARCRCSQARLGRRNTISRGGGGNSSHHFSVEEWASHRSNFARHSRFQTYWPTARRYREIGLLHSATIKERGLGIIVAVIVVLAILVAFGAAYWWLRR